MRATSRLQKLCNNTFEKAHWFGIGVSHFLFSSYGNKLCSPAVCRLGHDPFQPPDEAAWHCCDQLRWRHIQVLATISRNTIDVIVQFIMQRGIKVIQQPCWNCRFIIFQINKNLKLIYYDYERCPLRNWIHNFLKNLTNVLITEPRLEVLGHESSVTSDT